MPAPNEIIAAPLTVYLADVGTAFPAIDAVLPTGGWEALGTEGDSNYDEEGVTVSHAEEVYDFTPAGRTMPSKRFRTSESFEVSLNLVDVSPETYAKVMNDAAITDIGTAKKFSLYRGPIINSFAVVLRGQSSEDNDLNMQYEFSKAFLSVNGDVQYTKGKVAMLPIKIQVIRHADTDAVDLNIASADVT